MNVAPDRKGAAMKFALFRIGGDSIVECPTMDEVWTYVRANGLCSEETTHEDMPPRRILNPGYAIHTFDPDGELVAMSRTTVSYVKRSESEACRALLIVHVPLDSLSGDRRPALRSP